MNARDEVSVSRSDVPASCFLEVGGVSGRANVRGLLGSKGLLTELNGGIAIIYSPVVIFQSILTF